MVFFMFKRGKQQCGEEDKRPRARDRKFTDKADGTPAEHKRLQDMGIEKRSEIIRLGKIVVLIKRIDR